MNDENAHKGFCSPVAAGFKEDAHKVRYDLVPPFALEQLAKVYTYGALKYGDDNYRCGMRWSRIYAALERHIQAWRKGEDYDAESGQMHLASVAWCAFSLMEYFAYRQDLDDRAGLMPEVWKPFIGDSRWEVSSHGRVRNAKTGKVRKLSTQSGGYPCFTYRVPGSRSYRLCLVHRKVAEAFWTGKELARDEVVNHRDGQRGNNHFCNLEVGTQRGNMIAARRLNPEFWAAKDANSGDALRATGGVMNRKGGKK